MDKIETAEFMKHITDGFPGKYPLGVPNDVIESWALALKPYTFVESITAYRKWLSLDEKGFFPLPAQISVMAKKNRESVAKHDAEKPYDENCKYCNCGVITYYAPKNGIRYENMLTCVCVAEKRGDSPENIVYLAKRRDDLSEAGMLKYPFHTFELIGENGEIIPPESAEEMPF